MTAAAATEQNADDTATGTPLLTVENLRVSFGNAEVVKGISFTTRLGRCLAIVGESGSGKSVTARTLVGLTGPNSRVQADQIELAGVDPTRQSQRSWRAIRGRQIGFILQDALVSLDQLRRVGDEIAEPLKVHGWGTRASRQRKAIELLSSVGVPEPEVKARQRPYELSGGLRQRALIASAIALTPETHRRRRADHRARRHHPGPGARPARRVEGPGHVDHPDQPRPVGRCPAGRRGGRHAGRRSGERWRTRCCTSPGTTTPRCCSTRSPPSTPAAPASCRPPRARALSFQTRGGAPASRSTAAVPCSKHGTSPRSSGGPTRSTGRWWMTCRSSCSQARPSASSASRGRARPRVRGSRCRCCNRPLARCCYAGSSGRHRRRRRADRCASRSASSTRTRYAPSTRAGPSAGSSPTR